MNPNWLLFIDEYLADPNLNATAAYLKAYPNSEVKSAESSAARLLRSDKVAAEIAKRTTARSEKAGITAAWVLERLKLESERDGEGSTHGARVSALGLLGKHLSMFVDRVALEGGTTLRIVKEIVSADPESDPTDGDEDCTALPAAGPVPN